MKARYVAIDAARGMALLFMVWFHSLHWMAGGKLLDHTPFSRDWLMGFLFKPSPPLFIMCFGLMLGALVVNRPRPLKDECLHLWRRGLLVLLCYKLLFLLELFSKKASWKRIFDAMGWAQLSTCVEVMDFYFFVLMLAPLALWVWRRSPLVAKVGGIACLWWLTWRWQQYDWDSPILQALLVGRYRYYAFSLLPWGGTFLLGVLVGEYWTRLATRGRIGVVAGCLALAGVLYALYLAQAGLLSWRDFGDNLIFTPGWKHPPRVAYVALTTGYALTWLAVFTALLGADKRPPGMNPLEVIGRHPLTLFVFHWVMLLGVGCWAFGWYQRFQPSQAYGMGLGLMGMCTVLAYGLELAPGWLTRGRALDAGHWPPAEEPVDED